MQFLATTLTILSPLFLVVKYLFEYVKFEREIGRFLLSEITPSNIMGDRGDIKLGFKEDLYCEREIDKEIVNTLSKNTKSASIIVISGGISSGKSRAVYNYIKSPHGIANFKYVYIVNSENIKLVAEKIKSDNNKSELFIFDDVNFIYNTAKQSLIALLIVINSSKSRVAFITYANENTINDDNEEIVRWISNNALITNKDSRPLKYLKIADIEFHDQVHIWCLANLYDGAKSFSPIIGSYIKELEERIKEKTDKLFDNKNALDVLAAYITISKYRKNCSKELKYTFLMYAAQQSRKNTLANFNDGLETILELGYLSINRNSKSYFSLERSGGTNIDQNDPIESYIDDFISNKVDCEKQQFITIKDSRLFDEFKQRIALGLFRGKNRTITKFLLHNSDCEVNQAKALILINPKDPVYYSRAITKASNLNIERVINEVNQLLIANKMLTESKKIISSDEVKEEMCDLITVIIARRKWRDFLELKKTLRNILMLDSSRVRYLLQKFFELHSTIIKCEMTYLNMPRD